MYQAKTRGRNQCHFFDEAMRNRSQQKIAIESALRGIGNRNELALHYQPVVNCGSRKMIACEALLRWKTNDGEYIQPSAFIPIAEESGLIDELGKWVVRQACTDSNRIHTATGQWLKLAINISPRQLQSVVFAQYLKDTLAEYQLSPERIALAITENVLIKQHGSAYDNLVNLSNMGFDLAVDDFGTGYSSLSYLQKYPFSTLKIDQSFVQKIEADIGNRKLTEAIIQMAHSVNMQVIAEGVETEAQLRFLENSDCDFIQGYYFSQPLPFAQLLAVIKE